MNSKNTKMNSNLKILIVTHTVLITYTISNKHPHTPPRCVFAYYGHLEDTTNMGILQGLGRADDRVV